jgi:hypothetical protein
MPKWLTEQRLPPKASMVEALSLHLHMESLSVTCGVYSLHCTLIQLSSRVEDRRVGAWEFASTRFATTK